MSYDLFISYSRRDKTTNRVTEVVKGYMTRELFQFIFDCEDVIPPLCSNASHFCHDAV